MTADPRPTLAAPDDDPYLWLEEIEGARALAWVADQTKRTLARFGDARYTSDRDTLKAIFDTPERIPYVTRRGPHLYNFWQDAANPRGLWRRTTLARFRDPRPEWDVVLDLDTLATKEGEDWIWGRPTTLPPAHDRAIMCLSRGGSDAAVLREFDLSKREFVADGFALPEAKGGAAWLDADTLLLSSAFGGADMVTTSGYARTVRLWRRGTDVAQAPVLFETAADKMAVAAGRDRSQPTETVLFHEQIGFFDLSVSLGDRNGPKTKLDLPTDIELDLDRDWLVVKRRVAWTVGGRTHPADTLLGISLSAFLAGERDFTVLFAPGPRRVLEYMLWVHGKLLLAILDELQSVFEVLTPGPGPWARTTLQGLPPIGVAHTWRLDVEDHESNGDLLADVSNPITPSSFMLIEDGKAPAVIKQAPRLFNADGLVVTRHEAVSIDGERIPYVQTGPAGETGDAPVHLSGYGGFGITTKPHYDASVGKLWLERGGTSVTANIRGGGEFGIPWHDAGRRAGKRLSHDDFAAVAADLVRRGVTRPGRIAAEGGSNGGILITNMLTRYPERFGALFCTIPLIDMRRYHKLLAGASWIAEYGDPDKPEDWAFLQTYSAYHAAEPGRRYPPILLATSRKDDRVHPGHARKMAEKLQTLGYEAYFYEPAAGGHGYGKDSAERAAFIALGMTFLARAIGWDAEVAGGSHHAGN
jgi:prolyl oligopeptidase